MTWALLTAVAILAAAVGVSCGLLVARRRLATAADDEARRLVEIAAEAMTATDDVDACDGVVARLGAALGADAAAVGIVQGTTLQIFGMWQYAPQMRAHRLAPGEGLSGRAWSEGRPIVVPDVTRTATYVEGADEIRSGAYIPGRADGQVVAVLCVESRRRGAYGADDLPLLQAAADLLAAMLLSRRRAREAAALEDRPLPLLGREIRPALLLAQEQIDEALRLHPASSAASISRAHASARRVEQLLESLFAASRISSGVDVRVRDLPLQRAVRTAVHAAGAAPYVDVAIPSLLRVSADETLLVQVLRELLAEAAVPTQRRSAITAAPVADAVAVQVDVPDPGPLRRHVASRLVEAMRGRAEVDAMGTMSILLPPAGTDGWMPR